MTRCLRFAPAIAWATLIFFLSAQPRLPEPPVTFAGLDKLAHATVYGVLCLLLLVADAARAPRRVGAWVALTVAYGLSDEVHQSLVLSRSADGWDLLADAAGAVFFAALWLRRSFSQQPGAAQPESR